MNDPRERERRIEAAAAVIFDCDDPKHYERLADIYREQWRDEARQALDAADKAVPVVSLASVINVLDYAYHPQHGVNPMHPVDVIRAAFLGEGKG